MFTRLHAFARHASVEMLGRTELVLRKIGAEPKRVSFPPLDTVRVNLEAFADAVMGSTPYPITISQILATVSAFEAITKAVKTDQRVKV